MELYEELSNCCGAKIDGLNASGIGRCSECKEGCGVEGEDYFELNISYFVEVISGEYRITGSSVEIEKDGKIQNMTDYNFNQEKLIKDWMRRCKL